MSEMQGKLDLAKIYSGNPIPIEECNIVITQPSVKNICAFGEDVFFATVQLFCYADRAVEPMKEGNQRLAMLSDFQVLMILVDNDNLVKNNIIDLFTLIFPDYIIRFDPGSISFLTEESQNKIIGQINPMNFESFQQALKTIFLSLAMNGDKEQDYNPVNEQAAAIAEKLKRGNKIREQMKVESEQSKGSVFASYISILSVGLNIPVLTLLDYTPFQLFDSFFRYTSKLNYDLYQRVATTPMMDVSKMKEPNNWMDSLYSV